MTLHDRLISKVTKEPGGCWVWTAARDDRGYGRIGVAGRNAHAHRVAYEMFVGPIPVGLEIDHLCRVRHCVNPDHLEPVTHAENVRRGVRPDRHRLWDVIECPAGHPYTPENTTLWRGWRKCRTCHRTREQARRVRAKEVA